MKDPVAHTIAIAIALLLVTSVGWLIASGCSGGPSGQPVSFRLSPVAENASPSPSPDASPAGATARETAILYNEFGESHDTIWQASLSNLQQSRPIAVIPHAPFWGISPSLSPDAKQIAYVVLPPATPNPEQAADDQAEVWLQPLVGGEPRLIAKNADVRVAPIWSPDNASLVFQRVNRDSNSLTLSRVNIGDGTVSVLASLGGSSTAVPLTFSQSNDRFYVVQIGQEGTQLLAVTISDPSSQTVIDLPGLIARSWSPSPDGRSFAFINRSSAQHWELVIASPGNGSVSRLESEAIPPGLELFGPVWHPTQPLLTIGIAPGGDGGGVLNIPLSGGGGERLTGPTEGFDVPLAWSPAGDRLIVQRFSEYPVQRRPRLDILASDGQRQPLAGDKEVTFIAWLAQ